MSTATACAWRATWPVWPRASAEEGRSSMANVTFDTHRPSAEPIVGIDLGTTNSLVAIVRDGQPVVLEARGGGHLVPSVVSFAAVGDGADGQPIVGGVAKRAKLRDAAHTVFSVKRLLGRTPAQIRNGGG